MGPSGVPAPDSSQRRRARLFVLCGLVSAGALTLVYRSALFSELGDLRNLVATLLTAIPFALSIWLAAGSRCDRTQVVALVALAWLMRLAPPSDLIVATSDPPRYLWDGRVLRHGINPYLHAPQADALAPLRDGAVFPRIFRPDMRTVYPPLAELWFLFAALLSDGRFLGWKLVLLAHDTASVLLLVKLLRAAARPPLWAAAYAWSPLVVTQLFASAHLDALLVPWLLLTLLWAEKRPGRAGAALAAAALVRPLALLCLPSLVWRPDWRASLRSAGSFLGVYALGWLPFAGAGSGLWESLAVYSREWCFNASVFRLVEVALGPKPWLRTLSYIVIALGCAAIAALPLSLRRRSLLALWLYFALSPTVYPWYLVPLVALGALAPAPWVVALPVLAALSDTVYLHWPRAGPWEVGAPFIWLEYGFLGALLAWEAVRRRERSAT